MSSNNAKSDLQKQSSTIRLLKDPIRIRIEQLVSEYAGREWEVKEFRDMQEFSSHPAALLSDGSFTVFSKLSEAAHGQDQFEVELAGLRLLARRAGVLTPDPIGIVQVEGGVVLVLEAARAVARTPRQWREIGQGLAQIHQVKGDVFGLETQGYFGPLYQDNRPLSHWTTFYTERRLWPRLMGAIDSGNLHTEIIRQVESLILRLPGLDLPEVVPSLLHGDAQQNNFICTAAGAMVIDPAVYYGNPEIDLAYVDYFQLVPLDVFDGYREIAPIESGFEERRDLWRISGYLAAVQVEGGEYVQLLQNAVRKYL